MSPQAAIALVKDRGFSLRLIDREFHVIPHDGADSAVLGAINQLKGHLIDSLYLMDEINNWAGNDHKKWSALLDIARKHYEAVWELTPGGVLLTWVGNRYSYARGLRYDKAADISFFGRVVQGLEQRVPEALAADNKMADMFRRKVRRPGYGTKTND